MNLIKGSLIVTVIVNLVKAFERGYDNSALKKNVDKVTLAFKTSKTHYILSHYVNKKPYYQSSVVYRLVMAIASLLNKAFGGINTLGKRLFSGSVFAHKVCLAYKAGINDKLFAFGLLFMSIPVGSLIALIWAGQATGVNMAVCWAVFVAGVILVVAASCKDTFKNSKVVKAVSGFFDLIG